MSQVIATSQPQLLWQIQSHLRYPVDSLISNDSALHPFTRDNLPQFLRPRPLLHEEKNPGQSSKKPFIRIKMSASITLKPGPNPDLGDDEVCLVSLLDQWFPEITAKEKNLNVFAQITSQRSHDEQVVVAIAVVVAVMFLPLLLTKEMESF